MKLKIINPYNDEVLAEIPLAGKSKIEKAIVKAQQSFKKTKTLPSFTRSQILAYVAREITEKREDFAKTITLESAKPLKPAFAEVDRAISTFKIASEEANRIAGEYLPLDITQAANRRFGIVKRFPIGPIAAISPFNFPLNLVAHKIAPAIASGNPIVLKPASKTPLSALKLAEVISYTQWPKGALSIVVTDRETGNMLVTDPRFKMLTFTGSPQVGWSMKERAGTRKKVILELGGNAALIIDKSANLAFATKRALVGAFSFSGQSCISVQRIYIHRKIFDRFVKRFVQNVNKLKIGNPMDKNTDLGPMIDEKAAKRTEAWVNEAVADGGKLLTGGKAKGRIIQPTILTNVKTTAKVCSQEVFAPLVVLFPFSDTEAVLNEINDSIYGLQAGIFTNDHKLIWSAFEKLDVGGLIINDVPTFRVDNYPYGGTKESGMGREGIKYAIEDMTELKILVVNRQQE